MPRGGTKYVYEPDPENRITCVMRLYRGVVQDFTVQYDTFFEGRWVEVTRVDTSHGYAHQHTFNPNKGEVISDYVCDDYNEGLTKAYQHAKENHLKMRENYLTQARKRRL